MNNNLQRLIKQSAPFKSEWVKAEIGLIYVSYMLSNAMSSLFKGYGITSQQYNVMRILRGQHPNPSNINLIKDRMLDRMSDASRIVDRLVKLQLVTKQPSAIDKRNADVLITEEGLKLLRRIDERMEHTESMLQDLSQQEVDTLNKMIDRILDRVEVP